MERGQGGDEMGGEGMKNEYGETVRGVDVVAVMYAGSYPPIPSLWKTPCRLDCSPRFLCLLVRFANK